MAAAEPSATDGDDPFAILGIEPSAWLEEAMVRDVYQELARRWHPDVEGGDAAMFGRLGEAMRTLVSVPGRLRCLLERAGKDAGDGMLVPPEDLMGLFTRAAAVLEPWMELQRRVNAPGPALVKAMLEKQRLELLGEVQAVQAELESRWKRLEEALRNWDSQAGEDWEALRALQVEALFLDRWRRKLAAAVFG